MSQDLILNVTVPPECEVGSIINVLFEGKYYQVTVPAGAPGKTIEVTVPATEQTPANDAATTTGGGAGPAAEAPFDQVATETDTKNAQVAIQPKYVVGGAVIGTVGLLIVMPVVGAIVVIGELLLLEYIHLMALLVEYVYMLEYQTIN